MATPSASQPFPARPPSSDSSSTQPPPAFLFETKTENEVPRVHSTIAADAETIYPANFRTHPDIPSSTPCPQKKAVDVLSGAFSVAAGNNTHARRHIANQHIDVTSSNFHPNDSAHVTANTAASSQLALAVAAPVTVSSPPPPPGVHKEAAVPRCTNPATLSQFVRLSVPGCLQAECFLNAAERAHSHAIHRPAYTASSSPAPRDESTRAGHRTVHTETLNGVQQPPRQVQTVSANVSFPKPTVDIDNFDHDNDMNDAARRNASRQQQPASTPVHNVPLATIETTDTRRGSANVTSRKHLNGGAMTGDAIQATGHVGDAPPGCVDVRCDDVGAEEDDVPIAFLRRVACVRIGREKGPVVDETRGGSDGTHPNRQLLLPVSQQKLVVNGTTTAASIYANPSSQNPIRSSLPLDTNSAPLQTTSHWQSRQPPTGEKAENTSAPKSDKSSAKLRTTTHVQGLLPKKRKKGAGSGKVLRPSDKSLDQLAGLTSAETSNTKADGVEETSSKAASQVLSAGLGTKSVSRKEKKTAGAAKKRVGVSKPKGRQSLKEAGTAEKRVQSAPKRRIVYSTAKLSDGGGDEAKGATQLVGAPVSSISYIATPNVVSDGRGKHSKTSGKTGCASLSQKNNSVLLNRNSGCERGQETGGDNVGTKDEVEDASEVADVKNGNTTTVVKGVLTKQGKPGDGCVRKKTGAATKTIKKRKGAKGAGKALPRISSVLPGTDRRNGRQNGGGSSGIPPIDSLISCLKTVDKGRAVPLRDSTKFSRGDVDLTKGVVQRVWESLHNGHKGVIPGIRDAQALPDQVTLVDLYQCDGDIAGLAASCGGMDKLCAKLQVEVEAWRRKALINIIKDCATENEAGTNGEEGSDASTATTVRLSRALHCLTMVRVCALMGVPLTRGELDGDNILGTHAINESWAMTSVREASSFIRRQVQLCGAKGEWESEGEGVLCVQRVFRDVVVKLVETCCASSDGESVGRLFECVLTEVGNILRLYMNGNGSIRWGDILVADVVQPLFMCIRRHWCGGGGQGRFARMLDDVVQQGCERVYGLRRSGDGERSGGVGDQPKDGGQGEEVTHGGLTTRRNRKAGRCRIMTLHAALLARLPADVVRAMVDGVNLRSRLSGQLTTNILVQTISTTMLNDSLHNVH